MRITFVKAGGFNMSGGDRVISIYAAKLRERGHEVLVVSTPLPSLTLRDQFNSLIRGKGWLTSPPQTKSYFSDGGVPVLLLDNYRPVTDADVPDADIVISTWWETAEWVNGLSAAKGVKVSFLQHYEAFPYTPKVRVDATWRLPLHKITIAKWLSDLALQEFGDSDVSLVPNSVDTMQFHAPARERNLVPTVGLLYHDAPWKGVPVSVKALEEVRIRFPTVRLLSFGNTGPTVEQPLPSWAEATVVGPPQSGLKELYAKCDVWLCGSDSEGFGLTALEAMACRCPLVSTRVGGPADFIRDGVNGYLAPIGDSHALAEGLARVLALSPAGWKEMSGNALATAVGYTWDDATQLFEAALRHAIDRDACGELRAYAARAYRATVPN